MRIKLFTIPNIITLMNLMCGTLAVREVVANQNYTLAFWLVIMAAIFDFMDGAAARLLGQHSPLGVQLDSLADLISFGLAPTFVLFSLAEGASSALNLDFFEKFLPYITFIVVAFSALRLAKFNIDENQHSSFVGLPTPANALMCMSLGYICQIRGLELSVEWWGLIAVVMSVLMVSPLAMFSLKFKGLGWNENGLRYSFLMLAVVEIIVLGIIYALPAIVVSYILISLILALLPSRKA
ncbi:MAG: CDP-diacylglycerol--serine O-phosphatidyltransferase [Rikenellaceae bacterium]